MGEPTGKAAAATQSPVQLEARIRRLQTVIVGVMGALLLVLLVIGASLWYGLSRVKDLRVIHEVRPDAVYTPGHMYTLGEFLVNLSEPDHYVKTNVVLFLDDPKYIELAREREPIMKDVVVTVLSSKGIRDIAALEGKELLKKELRERLTAVLPKGRVMDVRLTQFQIQ